MYGHFGDECTVLHALCMTANAIDLYGEGLASMGAQGHRLTCQGCHRASNVKRNHGLHQGQLTRRVDKPGASLHADVGGPIMPMGIGGVKCVPAVIDEWSRFSCAFPMKKKSQTPRLQALLVERIML